MRIRIPWLLVTSALLSLPPAAAAELAAAAAPVQPITIIGANLVSPSRLSDIEAALVAQSHTLRRYYGTPILQFVTAGGWQLILAPNTAVMAGYADGLSLAWVDGFHNVSPQELPQAVVLLHPADRLPWSEIASHELLEMLVNPYYERRRADDGGPLEICDAVDAEAYFVRLRGGHRVMLADFVLPAWFRPDSVGPWDKLGLLKGAGQSDA